MVGVDIDGVLGNQVDGVLARVNARLGASFTYEDVIHWDVPLGDSSFKPEIAEAMKDPRYVLDMPVHNGSREMLAALREAYTVKVITVRPASVMRLTEQWLTANGLPYDELVRGEEELKSKHGVDALVDDYPKNLAEFFNNAEGPGILVDQPWNQDTSELAPALESGRLMRASHLREIPPLLAGLLACATRPRWRVAAESQL